MPGQLPAVPLRHLTFAPGCRQSGNQTLVRSSENALTQHPLRPTLNTQISLPPRIAGRGLVNNDMSATR
jgi:hypothetical protein